MQFQLNLLMQNLNRLVKKNLMILIRAEIECFSLFFYKKIIRNEYGERLQFFESVLNFWIHEGELLLLLLKDNSAYIIHQAIKKNFQQNIEIRLIPIVNATSLTTQEKYLLIIFMSNAIFGVLQDWVQRGRQESPKEITRSIDKIFKTVFI